MPSLLKDLVHYVCWRAADSSKLGAVKLNKVLWYSDTYAYRAFGQPITGARYEKRQFGPVPRGVSRAIAELEAEGRLHRRKSLHFNRVKHDFIALEPATAGFMSEDDRAIVDTFIDHVCDHHTAASISESTHDIVWAAAAMGEVIPYEAVLASTPGEITDEDMGWADGLISERHVMAA